jgi:hypothetical protein
VEGIGLPVEGGVGALAGHGHDALELTDRPRPFLFVDGVGALVIGVLLAVLGFVLVVVGLLVCGVRDVDVAVPLLGAGLRDDPRGRAHDDRQRGHGQHPSHAHQLTCE